MSQYIVSARKYRPSTFDTVVGQKALTSTLKNAIVSDRLAHAYLFCGSRGVGKTSCARIFAKTINCTNRTSEGEACNECDSCRAFNDNNSLNIVELDAASHNGIDDMKSLIEQVQIPPSHGKYRVFIIDEVHMLSSAAFNAFLKTLEEPPSYVIFILATTEKHKIIPTILSRCQIYDFSRITIKDMVAHLGMVARTEGISADPNALSVIARQADGAMRDALSIFDQVAASSRGNITYESTIENLNVLDSSYYARLVDAFEQKDIPAALLVYHEVRRKGFDSQFFLNGLGQYLRDLMLASSDLTLGLIDEPDDIKERMAAQARRLKPEFFYAAMGICNDADLNYRTSSNKPLLVEVTLIRIAQLLNPSPVKSGQGEGLKSLVKSPKSGQTTSASTPLQVQPVDCVSTQSAEPHTTNEPQASSSTAQPSTVGRRSTAGNPVMRIGAFSLHSNEKSPSNGAEVGRRTTPFTEQQLQNAWSDMASAFNSEPALQGILRKFSPIIAPDSRNVLVVDSHGTQEYIEERIDDIIVKMRDLLDNDLFVLSFSVKEMALAPEFWSDSQILSNMLQNAEFAEFYNFFGLSLT